MQKKIFSLMGFFGLASIGTAYGLVSVTLHPPQPFRPTPCMCAKPSLPEPTPEALIDSALLDAEPVIAVLPDITDGLALHMVGALMRGVQFWVMVPPGTVLPERLAFEHPGLRIRQGICTPYFVTTGAYVLLNGRVWRNMANGDELTERFNSAWDQADRNHGSVAHCRDAEPSIAQNAPEVHF